ncbi:hypothetical protein GCM10027034_15720 [Ramlibacter solisilvae]|uniref:Uncharacterized protein n=1 Tax=Ramlibacter tataouinensis TaxID=94132 RepID=A0A127JW37_9BURK|nr:hypothetical protein [Ramlibacter tataouinensis]AMO24226.1 hypothetical protein UC35_17010 [Ramlibacter tataouinensis]
MPFELNHPEFSFQSQRDWQQVATGTQEAMQLHCGETLTMVTLSMDEVSPTKGDLEPFARQVLAARKRAYLEAARELMAGGQEPQVTIDRESVEPHESALGCLMSFEGMHDGKSFVGYFGVLTRRKILHVFVETPVAFLPGRRGMFQEVVAGFTPKLP